MYGEERAILFLEFIKEAKTSGGNMIYSDYLSCQVDDFSENVQTEIRGYVILNYIRIKNVKKNDPRLWQKYPIDRNKFYFETVKKETKERKKKNHLYTIQEKIIGSEGCAKGVLQPYVEKLTEKNWYIAKEEYRDNPVMGTVFLKRK